MQKETHDLTQFSQINFVALKNLREIGFREPMEIDGFVIKTPTANSTNSITVVTCLFLI